MSGWSIAKDQFQRSSCVKFYASNEKLEIYEFIDARNIALTESGDFSRTPTDIVSIFPQVEISILYHNS